MWVMSVTHFSFGCQRDFENVPKSGSEKCTTSVRFSTVAVSASFPNLSRKSVAVALDIDHDRMMQKRSKMAVTIT